jgi:gluconate 2-dehydrogenase gamma chain
MTVPPATLGVAGIVREPHTVATSAGGRSVTTRREFLSKSGGILGGAWLASHWPEIARAHGEARAQLASGTPTLSFFTAGEAETFTAIAAQIVPSDGSPGAREAGVVYFADLVCRGALAEEAKTLKHDLGAFESDFRKRYPVFASFATAHAPLQEAHLHTVEQGEFFGFVHFLTVLGLLTLPEYGGNRDGVGWKLIGFDDAHVFQPPFGHYDRDYPGFELPAGKQS